MYNAAKENHREIVEYLIEQGANKWDLGLIGASVGGNLDMFNYLLSKAKGTSVHRYLFDNIRRSANDGKNGILKTVKGEKKYDEIIELSENIERRLFEK